MSSFRHPKLSAWERDETDGYYQAELHDWTLTTVWSAVSGGRGSFGWRATRVDGEQTLSGRSEESFAELADAMSDAEEFARVDALRRAHEVARRAEASATAGDH